MKNEKGKRRKAEGRRQKAEGRRQKAKGKSLYVKGFRSSSSPKIGCKEELC